MNVTEKYTSLLLKKCEFGKIMFYKIEPCYQSFFATCGNVLQTLNDIKIQKSYNLKKIPFKLMNKKFSDIIFYQYVKLIMGTEETHVL